MVSSILQTHHFTITNLLPTVDLHPVLSSLLSGGVTLPPSEGVHSTHLLKVSTDLPKDTFAMTTLYKPIIGLGGGICHIFHIFKVKYVKSSEY